jgi:hypothetical protein
MADVLMADVLLCLLLPIRHGGLLARLLLPSLLLLE